MKLIFLFFLTTPIDILGEATEWEEESRPADPETEATVVPEGYARPVATVPGLPEDAVTPGDHELNEDAAAATPVGRPEDAATEDAPEPTRRVEHLGREVMRLNSMLHLNIDPMVEKGGKVNSRPQTPQQVILGLNISNFLFGSY